jgi:hypothetical protein
MKILKKVKKGFLANISQSQFLILKIEDPYCTVQKSVELFFKLK